MLYVSPESFGADARLQRWIGQFGRASLSKVRMPEIALDSLAIKRSEVNAWVAGETVPRHFEQVDAVVQLARDYQGLEMHLSGQLKTLPSFLPSFLPLSLLFLSPASLHPSCLPPPPLFLSPFPPPPFLSPFSPSPLSPLSLLPPPFRPPLPRPFLPSYPLCTCAAFQQDLHRHDQILSVSLTAMPFFCHSDRLSSSS